jgi:hypothetical protein
MKVDHHFKSNFDVLEGRRLLSRSALSGPIELDRESRTPSQKLVGSIQGTEYSPADTAIGTIQLNAAGVVSPMGSVTATGVLLYAKRTGAVNSHGTLTLANSQGTLTLSMTKGQGYHRLKGAYFEGIPVSVRVASATGAFKSIHVSGTITLANGSTRHPVGSPVSTSLSVQFNLKPTK